MQINREGAKDAKKTPEKAYRGRKTLRDINEECLLRCTSAMAWGPRNWRDFGFEDRVNDYGKLSSFMLRQQR